MANLEARDLARSHPSEYRKMVQKCVNESQRGLFMNMNEPGSSLVFKEEEECHIALRTLMKEKLKDPMMVSRTIVLDCVQEAQEVQLLARKNAEAAAASQES